MTAEIVQRLGRLSVYAAFTVLVALAPKTEARAQVSEEQYISERNSARVLIRGMEAREMQTAPHPGAASAKEHEKALASLAEKLRALIGPVEIKGLQDLNETRPESVARDIGANALDSVIFGKKTRVRDTTVQVSTETLLERWLADQKARSSGKGMQFFAIPARLRSALVSDNFYSSAIDDGAAVQILSKLPIKKRPEAKHVVAMLEGRTQDMAVSIPDHLIITAIQGGLVFIAETPLKVKFGPIEECTAPVEDEPSTEYKKCFAANAPKYKAFIAAARQAQELYDSFPLRTEAQP